MTRLIVAICSTTGPGSGKSTFMETVVKPALPDAYHLRFSDPIVSFLCEGLSCLHGLGRSDYEALKRDELLPGITGRDFMIAAGDTLRKTLRPSFYSDILKVRLRKLPADVAVIIDDMRKLPELSTLENLVELGERLLIINVKKPGKSILSNDCEFTEWKLRRDVEAANNPWAFRYMEVTWDKFGSFKHVYMTGGPN